MFPILSLEPLLCWHSKLLQVDFQAIRLLFFANHFYLQWRSSRLVKTSLALQKTIPHHDSMSEEVDQLIHSSNVIPQQTCAYRPRETMLELWILLFDVQPPRLQCVVHKWYKNGTCVLFDQSDSDELYQDKEHSKFEFNQVQYRTSSKREWGLKVSPNTATNSLLFHTVKYCLVPPHDFVHRSPWIWWIWKPS